MGKRKEMKNGYRIYDTYAELYCRDKDDVVHTVKIDLDDLERLLEFKYAWAVIHSWTTGYYVRCTYYCGMIDGKPKYKMLYLHRFLMRAKDGEYVDHINQDSLDNRKSNLRVTSNDLNLKHRKGANKNNKTGCRNVCYLKKEDVYVVQFQVEGKNTVVGRFKDKDEAIEYANKMRQHIYGDFSGKSEMKQSL